VDVPRGSSCPAGEATEESQLPSGVARRQPAAPPFVRGTPEIERFIAAADLAVVREQPLREAGHAANLRRQRRDKSDPSLAVHALVGLAPSEDRRERAGDQAQVSRE
jgi:hypothetical protein